MKFVPFIILFIAFLFWFYISRRAKIRASQQSSITKDLAMQILQLKSGFTQQDLQFAYDEAIKNPKFADDDFYKKQIKRAYDILKEGL